MNIKYPTTFGKILVFSLLGVLFLSLDQVHAVAVGTSRPVRDHSYYFDAYDIEVVDPSPTVEMDFPHWAAPDPTQSNTDLKYRVNEVLPYEEDKNAWGYILYPEHGVITPMLQPNSYDQNLIDNGQLFDHYGYLEKGALHYFGDSPDEGVGNMVVAAHSSFKSASPGNYKTVFQTLPISQPGDKVYIYIKNSAGLYDFYEYTLNASFETNKYDVSVLRQDVDVPTLTTYGCFPIGSNAERWINVATLTDMVANHSNLKDTSLLVKNDTTVTEHAVAPQQPAEPTPSTETVTVTEKVVEKGVMRINTTTKPSLSSQLANRSIAIDSVPQPTKMVASTQSTTPAPTVEPSLTQPMPTPDTPPAADIQPEVVKDSVPVAIRIRYGTVIRAAAANLFRVSLSGKVPMSSILELITGLQEKYGPDDFKTHILIMLEEELQGYN